MEPLVEATNEPRNSRFKFAQEQAGEYNKMCFKGLLSMEGVKKWSI